MTIVGVGAFDDPIGAAIDADGSGRPGGRPLRVDIVGVGVLDDPIGAAINADGSGRPGAAPYGWTL